MSKIKLVLYGLLALIVVFLLGWLTAYSGQRTVAKRLQAVELRLGIAEAEAALSRARVDLFELNFGQAARNLDNGVKSLELVLARARDSGPKEMAESIGDAMAGARAAQDLAGRMEQAAGSRAADALRALERAAGLLPPQ